MIKLLVVIAIIAILMAVLMPALNRARLQGKRAACMGNLKQLTMPGYHGILRRWPRRILQVE